MEKEYQTTIKDKFGFVMEVMQLTYPIINKQQGIFTYTLLKDPLYVLININTEKVNDFNFDFFKRLFYEEAVSVIEKVKRRILNRDLTIKYLAPTKFEGCKDLHDSFVVHFVDGNKSNPIKFRKPNLQEKGNFLCELLKELWYPDIISGKVYKSLKGKVTKNHMSENNILEIERFIQNLKSNNTHDRVYEVAARYEIFCNIDLPYQDWTDPNMFEYLGEVNISF